ncbi:hypothetical protein DICPUDRAFT_147516 [Dictyostelium purpureum]|uniref:Protein kinase domain-containing protein n=1 Tax=Dictyostelium purpureum TaxID=5786 RepID=F0Z8P3_DICPU|nr:uncharacterized protein DICPUDRAFT_147516 [Dictyostelium purpureum]EGC39691.1 hypothetical protein DICPUDRAFT_147516 [Dictyostelium purpureum]|eukprot:XP_003283800.1 hypothetical protein DICPUDRAFT_147516 [Dictyostelium purpureum]
MENINDIPLHNPAEWNIDQKKINKCGAMNIGIYKGFKIDKTINQVLLPNDGLCVIKVVESKLIGKYEIDILNNLKKIKHQNIINVYGYGFGPVKKVISNLENNIDDTDKEMEERDLYIYMEYIPECKNIEDILGLGLGAFSEQEIKHITAKLTDTLIFLSNNHIVHRDIKPSNILYDPTTQNIKLIDFGISKYYTDVSKFSTMAGTSRYRAPEVSSRNGTASSKSDVWSLGCTIVEMAGGLKEDNDNQIPDSNDTNNNIVYKAPSIPPLLSDICKNFIQYCLILDPKFRYNASQLKEHEFLTNIPNPMGSLDSKNILVLTNIDCLNPIDIPTTINHLTLTDFDQDLITLHNKIPNSIKSLILPKFNQIINKDSIPSHIISLSIPLFNHDLDHDSIPVSLEQLTLGEAFDFNKYGGNLPPSIKKFTCAHFFQVSLRRNNNIPKGASEIILSNYNKPIVTNTIPISCNILTLGSDFQHFDSINKLPTSVYNLTFGVKNCQLKDEEIIKIIDSKSITKFIINRN